MDVVVVGAGLAGLTAASVLAGTGATVRVIESRPRVGGRMMTVATEPGGPLVDLGATWHWAGQPRIASLGADLGLKTFRQFDIGVALHDEPGSGSPSAVEVVPGDLGPALRFGEGAQELCDRLADRLPAGSVSLGLDVSAVTASEAGLSVTVSPRDGTPSTLSPEFVVMAVPPRLALDRIHFDPPLPDDLVGVMRTTATWMADAIKCVAVYESAFWRDTGLSGSAFSHAGPLSEVHDATSADGSAPALWALLSEVSEARLLEPAERATVVLAQLERFFGPAAADPVAYVERDWSADPNTNDPNTNDPDTPPDPPLAYGHAVFGRPVLGGRLVWAGAETESVGGGHMEGAVRSGERAARSILEYPGG